MLLSQICDLQAGWGLGSTHWVTSCKFYGPVRSHFSKLASFENMWGAHFLGWFVEGGSLGPVCSRGRWGRAQALGGGGRPEQAWPAPPRLGPPGCWSVTLSLLCFSSSCLQQTLPPVFGRMLQRLRSLLLSVPPAAVWIKMARGSREKEEKESRVWYWAPKFGSQASCSVTDEW